MIDLKPACAAVIGLLDGVTDDRLDDPTPCAEFTVGDLIDHLDEVSHGFAGFARKIETPRRVPGADRDRVAGHVRELGEAWDDPEAWTGSGDAGGLELSNDQWGRIALTEMVVHGWDLATATGRPFVLPEPTLRACLDHVAVFVPNAPIPQLWGTPTTLPADVPLIDRIVAITGRTP